MSQPTTLLELIGLPPADSTAIVLPEAGIRVSYQQLRDQVSEMADALASLGISRGDRVATYLPNLSLIHISTGFSTTDRLTRR